MNEYMKHVIKLSLTLLFLISCATNSPTSKLACPIENSTDRILIGYLKLVTDVKDDLKNCYVIARIGNEEKINELKPDVKGRFFVRAKKQTTFKLEKLVCDIAEGSKFKIKTIDEPITLKKISFSDDPKKIGYYGSIEFHISTNDMVTELAQEFGLNPKKSQKKELYFTAGVAHGSNDISGLTNQLEQECPSFSKDYEIKENLFKYKK